MKTTRKLICLFLFLCAPAAFAQASHVLGSKLSDWGIYHDDYGHYLGLKKVKMKIIKLVFIGPGVELEKLDHPEQAPNIVVIQYTAGSAGTSVIATSHRAVLYDLEKQSFIGNAPIRVELSNGNVLRAKWTYKDGELIVKDDEEGTLKFNL